MRTQVPMAAAADVMGDTFTAADPLAPGGQDFGFSGGNPLEADGNQRWRELFPCLQLRFHHAFQVSQYHRRGGGLECVRECWRLIQSLHV